MKGASSIVWPLLHAGILLGYRKWCYSVIH